jgi:dephospho-CoA kinase
MMVVGLTGGIGSGKSTIAKLFQVLRVPVYDTDTRAKETYYKPEVKEKILALLGAEAYTSEGKIDPAVISKKVFGDNTLLQKLNGIIHPAVDADFKAFLEENSGEKLIVKESALLFETGVYKKMDKNILVTSPLELRVKRVQDRDKTPPADIMKRIGHQMPDEEKIPISDFVIINDEKEAVIPQVLAIYEKLKHA